MMASLMAPAPPLLDCRLRSLLHLAVHYAYLLQHAHEIVKEIFFHDLTFLVPAGYCTEIHSKALVRGLNNRSARHRHRTFHRSRELRYCARPFTLRQHDLIWMVGHVLVWKHFEECSRLLLVGIYAMGGRLIRPAYNAIFRVIFSKCLQVLSVPRIIQRLHIF